MLDKTMLVGALNNDKNLLQESINEATKIGKLIGRMEFVSGLISVLEKGSFDFVNKDDAQSNLVKDIDDQLDGHHKSEKTVGGVRYTEANQIIDDATI